MKQFIFIFFLFLLAFAAAAQPSNRVRLRQLEAAPGSGYIIQSLNDTCLWVGVSSVVKYQTLRDDGTPVTQRDAINFVATSTVATTLTDDAGNGETEVALSVPTGGITSTQILDGTITTSDLAFTPVTDHGALTGLPDDDHTQYLLLAGRSTGQTAIGGSAQMTLVGGTGTTADLNLKTTTGVGATGADIHFLVGNNGATEAMTILNNGRIGMGTTSPDAGLKIEGDYPFSTANPLYINNTSTNTFSPSWISLQPNAGAGDFHYFALGKSVATNNMVTTEYVHTADASTSNRYSMKFHSANYFFTANANGRVGLGSVTVPVNTLDVEGAAAIGATYSGTSTAPANGLLVEGNTGIGTSTVVNKLDVEGAAAIGATYSGTSTAPANGLLVEGRVGIGETTLGNYKMKIFSNDANSSVVEVKNNHTQGYSGFQVTNDAGNRMGFGMGNSAAAQNPNEAYFTVIDAIPFIIETNDATRLYIDNNETKIGIGNTAPGATLHLTGAGSTTTTTGFHYENSTGTDVIFANDGGQVGILTNLPARTLHVAGEARITDLTTDTPTRIVGADADGDLNEITMSSELDLTGGVLSVGVVSHSSLSDLGSPEDDHPQYLHLPGRVGGQIVYGGDAASNNLDLNSTSNATKGNILLQDEGGNVILGGAATASRLRMLEASGSGTNYTEFVTQAQAANVTYTLPADDGDSGEQLQTNGSGTLSWEPTGKTPDVQIYPFSGTDTYVIPTGVRTVEIVCIGGGGGGGSGRRGATTEANTGGGGGGGGAYTVATFAVSELASSTLDLTIGAGGNNGAARSTDNTNGADGTAGGATYVECSGYLIIYAGGGEYGTGGTVAASTGGTGSGIGDFDGVDGAGCPDTGSPSAPMAANKKSGAGGGAGGGIPTGGTPARNGGATGKWNYGQEAANAGGTAPGGNGSDADALNAQHFIGGNGGSGGASSITAAAGAGGDGLQGGGGGGGGASLNATGNSGAGGDGGDGYLMIIAKY